MDKIIEEDGHMAEDVPDDFRWVKVRLSIPSSEAGKHLQFRDMIISRFTRDIQDLGDRDVHIDGNWCCFFIPAEGRNAKIGKIKDIIEEITPSDRNNFIRVKYDPANVPISVKFGNIQNAQDILAQALQKLYDTANDELNLSNLKSNIDLRENGMELDLRKTDQFALLVRVLCLFPLQGCKKLNLSNNGLRNLQQLEPLIPRMPILENLNLSSNLLNTWDDLGYVSRWPIKSLNITDCLLNKKMQNKSRMKVQKEVRQRFKTMQTFNGRNFAARVGFELDKSSSEPRGTPKKRDSALPNVVELQDPLYAFITKFINAFDNDRAGLLHLYSNDAVFTMSVGFGTDLQKYRQHQRNMIIFHNNRNGSCDKYRTPHPNSLKRKKLSIIALFDGLPATKHDLANSTYCDVTLQIPSIVGFTLTGTLKEIESGKIRYFSRHILSQYVNNSFIVQHDQLFIRAATHTEQRNHGIKQTVEAQPVSSVKVESKGTNEELITKFAADSGMKTEYSRLCLEENNFDYQQAAKKFHALKTEGKIPADAWQPGRAPS